jgi:hypothetical protein
MLQIAFLIGAYSCLIFILGISRLLYPQTILVSTILFILIFLFLVKHAKIDKNLKLDFWSKGIIFLLASQSLINLVGALGPEISFDSLWYHLTLPKLYLLNHNIFHISGGLLYYSDMPKSIEMLYISALSLGGEVWAKLVHYVLGIFSVLATYKLARKFYSQKLSLLSSLIFYSSLVVGWQSTTAHIDLGRTFFEILALWQFIEWIEDKSLKKLIYSGTLIGMAVSTKVVAVNSFFIFLILVSYYSFISKVGIKTAIKNLFCFLLPAVFVPLPWFIFSFTNTGNPFYPLFDSRITLSFENSFLNIPKLFILSPDPINPLYIISLPFILLAFRKFDLKLRILFYYSVFSLFFWFAISAIGGSRFILPYLSAYSVLSVSAIFFSKNKTIQRNLLFIILLVSVSSILYRGVANLKYLKVVLGGESKDAFLSRNLNFSFGDFYDTDGYFKTHINKSDKVLLIGFHNLYYVDFPFIDSSWVQKGDKFNYIAVQNSSLPKKFLDFKEIYYNAKTGVRLYTDKKKTWTY